jgi:diguanylate cyclase (GGDEF)-like protein
MSRLIDALLEGDSRQRLRLMHSGLGFLLMACAVVLMHYMTASGLNDGRGLWAWTAFSLAGMGAPFLLIRSGRSQRWGDPSLTVPQMLYSIACAAAAYAIAGRGQGAALVMLTVALMFGAFGMSRRQAWLIGSYTIAVFAAVMAWRAVSSPAIYPAPVQVVHFAMICIFLVGIVAVAARIGMMRARILVQRADLAAAMERLSMLATIDELTGLSNRRCMRDLLEAERERSLRVGHSWSVAILDIDHFKRINDAHGHAAGDAVLRAMAAVGLATVRRCDSIARWGGEEFVLLLRDVDATGASTVAGRVRQALQHARIAVDGASLNVTASIGLASHCPGESVEATMCRADRALYAAKAGGRNRVVAEESGERDPAEAGPETVGSG